VVFFFCRAGESLSCETRLHPDGPGFQLVVTENDRTHVEEFQAIAALLAREHQLLHAWRAQGWHDVGSPPAQRSDRQRAPPSLQNLGFGDEWRVTSDQ
jgi:hypothetical protein